MKRARPGQNQNPNFSRRLAVPARKLISAALPRREAIAACARLLSAQRCDLMNARLLD
jgi:hypothetical protein